MKRARVVGVFVGAVLLACVLAVLGWPDEVQRVMAEDGRKTTTAYRVFGPPGKTTLAVRTICYLRPGGEEAIAAFAKRLPDWAINLPGVEINGHRRHMGVPVRGARSFRFLVIREDGRTFSRVLYEREATAYERGMYAIRTFLHVPEPTVQDTQTSPGDE